VARQSGRAETAERALEEALGRAERAERALGEALRRAEKAEGALRKDATGHASRGDEEADRLIQRAVQEALKVSQLVPSSSTASASPSRRLSPAHDDVSIMLKEAHRVITAENARLVASNADLVSVIPHTVNCESMSD